MKNAQGSMSGLEKGSGGILKNIASVAGGLGVFKLMSTAINVVRDSIGGAIDRFDTLNKYPVVMQALGYSAKDVDKSMSYLTKSIDGLPTSLDEIVSSTQQLAISTGSLDKGTKTAVALNNAFLASGSSTADATRGMQQYQQMLAKGTVDMQSWRTLQETMPIAMDKVAKSFKDRGVNSVNELYDALQSGGITFEEFNNRMIKLNDGVGGFAELAKKNSAGIKTSFSNIKTAVVKNLANMLTAIDKGMQDAGLGSIASNLDKVKDAVNKAFGVIIKLIPPAIEVLVKAAKIVGTVTEKIKAIIDVLKPFAPILLPIIGAFAAFIIKLKGISAVILIFKNLSTAIKGVMTTMKILTALIAANPFTILIGAIIGLVAAFAYLWKTNEKFRAFWIDLWETVKKTVATAVEWITGKWSKFTSWFSDTWSSIKKGADTAFTGMKDAPGKAAEQIKSKWTNVKGFFSDVWSGVKESASSTWESVVETVSPYVSAITSVFQPMINFFSDLWSQIGSMAGSAWEIIKTVVMGPILLLTDLITGDFTQLKEDAAMLWQTLSENVMNIVSNFVAVVVGYYTALKDTAINIWNAIVATIKSLWSSFTSWVSQTTDNVVNSVKQGWNNLKQGTIDTFNSAVQAGKNAWQSFKDWMKNTIDNIVQSAINGWNNLKQWTINTFNNIVDGAKQAWSNFKQGVMDLVNSAINTFNQLRNINLLDIGRAIMDGFFNGLKSAWGKVQDFVSGIGDWIREHKGPMRVDKKLLIPAGTAIMNGLNKGLIDGFGAVQSNVAGMAKQLAAPFNDTYDLGISSSVSKINKSVSGEVNHQVNLNNVKQPATFNIRFGNQQFKAFVDDISQAQGSEAEINLLF